MKPCFGYIRVSTVRQGDGASLEAQKDAITGFASRNNLTVIKWFEEQETASKTGRPVLDAMLRELRRGAAEGLIIHKTDRFSRNYTDWGRIEEIVKQGVKFYVAAESLDFDNISARLMADINMALAAHYSRNLSAEVKKGIYGRAKQGVYPFRAPLGYLDTGGGNPKAIDPVKGPLVRQIFELYCTGEYSITSLTEEMRQKGLKGFGEQLVVRRNVETILRNPFYCGKMQIGGNLYPGAHEPLISAKQFQRVAAIKATRYQKKSTKHQMLFRGFIRCRTCKKVLTGERQKAHRYYRCHTKSCAGNTIREDRLETQLVERLRELQVPSADREKLEARMQNWIHGAGLRDIEKSIRMRIADATAKEDRLTDLLVDGTISKEAFDLRKRNAEFELQRLREDLVGIENSRTAEQDLLDLVAMATDLVLLYEAAPDAKKRALIRNCLKSPMVSEGWFTAEPSDWLSEVRHLKDDPKHMPRIDMSAATKRVDMSLSRTPGEQ